MTKTSITGPVDTLTHPLLTVREAATLLKVSPRTIRRMIDDERLRAVRLGRIVRIRPEALAALVK